MQLYPNIKGHFGNVKLCFMSSFQVDISKKRLKCGCTFLTMEVIIMPSAENHEKQLLNNYLNPFNVQAQNAYLVKRYLKLFLRKDISFIRKLFV